MGKARVAIQELTGNLQPLRGTNSLGYSYRVSWCTLTVLLGGKQIGGSGQQKRNLASCKERGAGYGPWEVTLEY